MDLSIFTTPEAWISLVTLIFLRLFPALTTSFSFQLPQAGFLLKTAHRSQARSSGCHDFRAASSCALQAISCI